MDEEPTIEWFGATTFRLNTPSLTIFLDTWLDRPSSLPQYLPISSITKCDYILISHAHFDHLPGADRIALSTGATIIGNGEAISVMRAAGVPESQLLAVSGGETIPLGAGDVVVKSWPSTHCIMPPGDHRELPEELDTGTVYLGREGGTLDVTRGMAAGFGGMIAAPDERFKGAPEGVRSFREWIKDRERNRYSFFDGGQIMYSLEFMGRRGGSGGGGGRGNRSLLWSAHMGGYEGVLRGLPRRPDVAILAAAGRAVLDGEPWQGSAAEFLAAQCRWLKEPERVFWCLHDEQPLKPYRIRTEAATKMVEERTRSKVWTLTPAVRYRLFVDEVVVGLE
ncbi:hypothetical protein BZA05DRAFT_475267 [Tricharina praecox]|uniref:uncharacterized protein n=1 Tax=Tricharina praecox TaxID=43433 RepID=UPI002220ED69|nr:uncharacterized protein BZA05DRAFT_475267 [Tricharina praecox]KAI5848954.1 hypothetical protein BZA05DRAFT_475267 [Tricharina praecox]